MFMKLTSHIGLDIYVELSEIATVEQSSKTAHASSFVRLKSGDQYFVRESVKDVFSEIERCRYQPHSEYQKWLSKKVGI